MKIQPTDASQLPSNFKALKFPEFKTVLRKTKLANTHEQSRHYIQEVFMSLAFVAATFTKYFIDICNSKQKSSTAMKLPTKHSAQQINIEV